MTTSALEQIKKHNLYQATQHVWYKKFPYRISLTGYWPALRQIDNQSNKFKREVTEKILSTHRRIRKYLKSGNIEFKTRSDINYNFYLKTAEDVVGVLSIIDHKHITEINGPLTEKMQSLMLDDISTIFKKDLIYKKFRYKIDTEFYRKDDEEYLIIDEVRDFVNNSFEPNTFRFGTNIHAVNYHRTRLGTQVSTVRSLFRTNAMPWRMNVTIYTNSYDDVCTFHLIYKKHIRNTTKVILLDEI